MLCILWCERQIKDTVHVQHTMVSQITQYSLHEMTFFMCFRFGRTGLKVSPKRWEFAGVRQAKFPHQMPTCSVWMRNTAKKRKLSVMR